LVFYHARSLLCSQWNFFSCLVLARPSNPIPLVFLPSSFRHKLFPPIDSFSLCTLFCPVTRTSSGKLFVFQKGILGIDFSQVSPLKRQFFFFFRPLHASKTSFPPLIAIPSFPDCLLLLFFLRSTLFSFSRPNRAVPVKRKNVACPPSSPAARFFFSLQEFFFPFHHVEGNPPPLTSPFFSSCFSFLKQAFLPLFRIKVSTLPPFFPSAGGPSFFFDPSTPIVSPISQPPQPK